MKSWRSSYRLPPIKLWAALLEIGIILLSVWIATQHLQDFALNRRLGGSDIPLLTSSANFAAAIFQKTGVIPLWNPFTGNGEPMLESVQSFLLNPLMSGPILLLGPINGSKVTLLLHIGLMGLGGWSLARVLRLEWSGRILLGVLLAQTGSMAGPMGRGVIQLALSQAYVPWVITGLIGTLNLPRRWPILLLALSSALLVFAGTFWYVLPTAITAIIIVAFHLFRREDRQLAINRDALRRLIIATCFLFGLILIRLLPLNRNLLYHPTTSENLSTTFFGIMTGYFFPATLRRDLGDAWADYHYVFPFFLLVPIVVVLVIQLTFFYREDRPILSRWQIIMPALIAIVIYTIWAQGQTPLIQQLYEAIPFLSDWRNTGRMAAAASIWVAVLGAIGFDNTVCFLRKAAEKPSLTEPLIGIWAQVKASGILNSLAVFGLLITLLVAFWACADTSYNWQRFVTLSILYESPTTLAEAEGLYYLRANYPNEFLSVQNEAWLNQYAFTETLSRHVFGDGDVFTVGLPSTIGGTDPEMSFTPEFSVGVNPGFVEWMRSRGYHPFTDSQIVWNESTAWMKTETPPYAFIATESRLRFGSGNPLTRAETQDVTYYHGIDTIWLTVDTHPEHSVLVVNETAYPGWFVTVDGRSVAVESVGHRLGVFLPDKPDGSQTQVVFAYRPPKIYEGAFILILTAVGFVIFALRLDLRVPRPTRKGLRRQLGRLKYLLTTPGLFEEGSHEESEVEQPDVTSDNSPENG